MMSVDAVHSLSDLIADGMALITVKKSRQDPDPLYPQENTSHLKSSYGHGKVEALGSMGIALFLMGTAVMIGWDSYLALQDVLVNQTVNDYGASQDIWTYVVGIILSIHPRVVLEFQVSVLSPRKFSIV